MADNIPDISGIVKMIMSNPSLISEISAMVNKAPETKVEAVEGEGEVTLTETEDSAVNTPLEKSKSRKELLAALKPYLSEKRGRAIDSMLSVAEVLSVIKR